MAFGVLQILMGALAAFLIPMMILGRVMSATMHQPAMPLRQLIPGILFYGFAACVFVTLGIGSLKCRRWARALSLVVGWTWLLMGVVGIAAMAFALPQILRQSQPAGQQLPEGAMMLIMLIPLLVMGVFFILAPAVLVVFYRSRHVKATCEALNPIPSWTDAAPLPLLGASLWMGSGALMMLSIPVAYNGGLPLFGHFLRGLPGAGAAILLAAVWGYAAWGLYRKSLAAWWVGIISMALAGVSSWLTFKGLDLMDIYQQMGYTSEQLAMMKQFNFLTGSNMAWLSVAGSVVWIVFLLCVLPYFRKARPGANGA